MTAAPQRPREDARPDRWRSPARGRRRRRARRAARPASACRPRPALRPRGPPARAPHELRERVDPAELALPVARVARLAAKRQQAAAQTTRRQRPLGPEVVQVRAQEARQPVDQVEWVRSPASRAKRTVCAGSRRPTTTGALPRARGTAAPEATGRSDGRTGSTLIRNGMRRPPSPLMSTATPSRSERPQRVPAISGDDCSSSAADGTRRARATRGRRRSARRSCAARRGPDERRRSAPALGATTTTPGPWPATPRAGRGRRRGPRGEREIGPVVRQRDRRPVAEQRPDLRGAQRAAGQARQDLAHGERDQRVARVEVEHDAGAVGRHEGERVRERDRPRRRRAIGLVAATQEQDQSNRDDGRRGHRHDQSHTPPRRHRTTITVAHTRRRAVTAPPSRSPTHAAAPSPHHHRGRPHTPPRRHRTTIMVAHTRRCAITATPTLRSARRGRPPASRPPRSTGPSPRRGPRPCG